MKTSFLGISELIRATLRKRSRKQKTLLPSENVEVAFQQRPRENSILSSH